MRVDLMTWEELSQGINSVLGTSFTDDSLRICAKAIFDLEREINKKLGHTKQGDTLPPRIINYELEYEEGTKKLTKKDFDTMLKDYYQKRGWE